MKAIRLLILLIMFASILKFFGCSKRTHKKNKSSNKYAWEEELRKSVENFKNRTIYKEITNEIIDTTTDDQLLQTIFDNLSRKLPEDYTEEYEAVLAFSKPRQAIYIIWLLEGEVNNGGFNQFYFNSSGQFAKLTPDALKLIGATKFSDLVIRANKIYAMENKNITKHQDGTLEGFSKSYNNNPLNDLDEEFYELYKIEDLNQLQIDFIRKNKIDFIDE